MIKESPRKSRTNLPEARPIPGPPPAGSLGELRRLAQDCHRCDLWKAATQTVFGEGPARA